MYFKHAFSKSVIGKKALASFCLSFPKDHCRSPIYFENAELITLRDHSTPFRSRKFLELRKMPTFELLRLYPSRSLLSDPMLLLMPWLQEFRKSAFPGRGTKILRPQDKVNEPTYRALRRTRFETLDSQS